MFSAQMGTNNQAKAPGLVKWTTKTAPAKLCSEPFLRRTLKQSNSPQKLNRSCLKTRENQPAGLKEGKMDVPILH